MLKKKKHPDGVELMSSDDLKPHVGHKVSVTGIMQGDSAMSDDKMFKDSIVERQHGGVWIQGHEHEHGVRAMRRAGRDDEEVAYCD
jgi:hypothetical protein